MSSSARVSARECTCGDSKLITSKHMHKPGQIGAATEIQNQGRISSHEHCCIPAPDVVQRKRGLKDLGCSTACPTTQIHYHGLFIRSCLSRSAVKPGLREMRSRDRIAFVMTRKSKKSDLVPDGGRGCSVSRGLRCLGYPLAARATHVLFVLMNARFCVTPSNVRSLS